MQTNLIMKDMSKRRKSLATTKGKDTSHRAKPLVAGAGYMGGRKPYKCGGQVNKCNFSC